MDPLFTPTIEGPEVSKEEIHRWIEEDRKLREKAKDALAKLGAKFESPWQMNFNYPEGAKWRVRATNGQTLFFLFEKDFSDLWDKLPNLDHCILDCDCFPHCEDSLPLTPVA